MGGGDTWPKSCTLEEYYKLLEPGILKYTAFLRRFDKRYSPQEEVCTKMAMNKTQRSRGPKRSTEDITNAIVERSIPNVSVERAVELLKGLNIGLDDGKPKGDPRFWDKLLHLWDVHCEKSNDYGDDDDIYANLRGSEEAGVPAWIGVVLRMNDKVKRVNNLAKNKSLKCEPVEDSFRDIAGYALLAWLFYEETQQEKS